MVFINKINILWLFKAITNKIFNNIINTYNIYYKILTSPHKLSIIFKIL